MKLNTATILQYRKKLYAIVEVGAGTHLKARGYDLVSAIMVILNLAATIAYTFDTCELRWGPLLLTVEAVTVAFFAIDYILRILTARFAHPGLSEKQAIRKYVLSGSGIVDLLSFLPYYLPLIFFTTGAAAFRMLRVVRIFRLFRINAYSDSLSIIGQVLSSRKQQLLSSVFIILVLMVASSLCMYSLEHEAQPEVFSNAFSGIWWSVSTLLTVGYGDIYPITTLGQIFSIVITFLGVGMVAIPTGIISAGFVDQYSRLKKLSEYGREEEIHFIKTQLRRDDLWVGKAIKELGLPHGIIVAAVRHNGEIIVPRGDVILKANDTIILGAESIKDDKHIELKEIEINKHNPWNGQRIRDLDISRQTMIVMIRRSGKMVIPKGSLVLLEGDHVILYTQTNYVDANLIQV